METTVIALLTVNLSAFWFCTVISTSIAGGQSAIASEQSGINAVDVGLREWFLFLNGNNQHHNASHAINLFIACVLRLYSGIGRQPSFKGGPLCYWHAIDCRLPKYYDQRAGRFRSIRRRSVTIHHIYSIHFTIMTSKWLMMKHIKWGDCVIWETRAFSTPFYNPCVKPASFLR